MKKIITEIEAIYWKKRGFTDSNVYRFIGELHQDFKSKYSWKMIRFAHKHGFFVPTVIALGITENNYQDYLNDYDYWKLFPLDRRYHNWICNKLDLKILLGDLGKYMPDYYYQLTHDEGILRLQDCPDTYGNTIEDVISLIHAKHAVGLKDIYGYFGIGFYKAEEKNGIFFVNDKEYSHEEFKSFLLNLDNFVVMEYLDSAGVGAEIYPKTANSIRYIIGINKGKQYKIGSFIKFGNSSSGYVDNLTGGGISCPIDEKGHFEYGYTKVNGVMTRINVHPDTGHVLQGTISEWSEIERIAQLIIARLPQLTHMGFDFVVSTKGIRLLEINDKSGMLTIQKAAPLLKNREDNFYLKRLQDENIL